MSQPGHWRLLASQHSKSSFSYARRWNPDDTRLHRSPNGDGHLQPSSQARYEVQPGFREQPLGALLEDKSHSTTTAIESAFAQWFYSTFERANEPDGNALPAALPSVAPRMRHHLSDAQWRRNRGLREGPKNQLSTTSAS
jgi:hypothetical protein